LCALVLGASSIASSSEQLPLEPVRQSGQGVTAAYEGWYRNPDGTINLLVGYFNRNEKEVLDIPVGPDNRIDPGGPDRGQPTHFLPRRQWGVFTITVPADFGSQKLIWTLVANGKLTQIPMGLNPLWEVEPFQDAAQGNTPPVLRFAPDGAPHQGPPREIAHSLEGRSSEPLTLTVWAKDDALVDPDRTEREGPPVTVKWSKLRGPGNVSFENEKPEVDPADGKATTTASFSKPGEYVLRLQANDVSGEGGGGFQCCWTNAHVKVTVSGLPESP
jgi:hypothetical protein